MADPAAFMSIAGSTSNSPSKTGDNFYYNSSSSVKAGDDGKVLSTSSSLFTSEQDHLDPAQLRTLAKILDLTNANHVKWLKAEISIEAQPDRSDLTQYGQDQLFHLITTKTMFVKNWLRVNPPDRPFETYQFLRYIESLTPASLSLMYNPKILNLTISDGGIEMKVTMERSEPLSPHCYVYQNRYVVTGEVLQHHGLEFNMRGSTGGLAWHSAFLWRGENFKWLRYGPEGDERPMDTPQSVSAKPPGSSVGGSPKGRDGTR